MTATEELRRMLDERGVEWWKASPCKTKWYSPVLGGPVAVSEWNGEMVLDAGYESIAPAQAIDATLGRGTCKDVSGGDPCAFVCSECNATYDHPADEPILYCPNCGRRVEP